MTLLLVDDDFDHVALLIERLKKEDEKIRIVTAMSPSDAISSLAKYRGEISAIVADMHTSARKALDLVKVVRSIGFSTPFFIFSNGDVTEKEALHAGATGVFPKSVVIGTLMTALRKSHARSRLRKKKEKNN